MKASFSVRVRSEVVGRTRSAAAAMIRLDPSYSLSQLVEDALERQLHRPLRVEAGQAVERVPFSTRVDGGVQGRVRSAVAVSDCGLGAWVESALDGYLDELSMQANEGRPWAVGGELRRGRRLA